MESDNGSGRAKRKVKPVQIRRGSMTVRIYDQTKSSDGIRYSESLVCWYDSERRRMRRSFADPKGARLFAEEIASTLSRGEVHGTTLNGVEVSTFKELIRIAGEFGVGPLVAMTEWRNARSALPPGVSMETAVKTFVSRFFPSGPTRSVTEVFEEFHLDRRQSGVSQVYLRDLQTRLGTFSQAFQMPIGQVRASIVRDWLRNLKGPTGTPLTVRSQVNYCRVVGSLFQFARKQRYVDRDLAEEISEIDVGRPAPSKTGIFTPDQMERLLRNCPDDLIPPLAIAAFCGLRIAEVSRLDWKDVDLKTGFITVGADKAKTATRRIVPISSNLRAWLERLAQTSGPVNPSTDDRGLNHRWVRGPAAKAGVTWVKNGLRHSFCSYRLAQTGDAARTALETGNSPAMIFRHYRELVTPQQAAAWFGIFPA
jgi:integrase